ncbi:MAG: OsmC family protein [Bacteroidia bacterium]|nr:OsmC family protein [Bacteroidia bacterium]
MANITANIKNDLYKVTVTSETGNTILADEPMALGGLDLGLNPKELLVASLASCTLITLRMYTNHKKWDLKEVDINVTLHVDEVTNETIINRKLTFIGNLDDTQKQRLLAVANACPVHKILSNTTNIITQ